MRKVLDLTNEMCRTLIDVERAGIKIDEEALDHLETAYRQEYAALERELNELASKALGDTPFKLSSNDDLSMLIIFSICSPFHNTITVLSVPNLATSTLIYLAPVTPF